MKNDLNLRYRYLLAVVLFVLLDPALANKFETIGGGLSGSSGFKREWLQKFFLVVGGASLLGAILAVLVPHGNALFLNYNNWKQSAVMFSVLAAVMFAAAAFI